MQIVESSGRENYIRQSVQFSEYCSQNGVSPTGEKEGGHPVYAVSVEATATRDQIVDRLCGLGGGMMVEFDSMPTGVDPKQQHMEFANELGIFRCTHQGVDYPQAA